MMIKKIWAASFSPTGGTEHIVSLLAEEMGKCLKLPVHKIFFTLPDERKKELHIYGGRSADPRDAGVCRTDSKQNPPRCGPEF